MRKAIKSSYILFARDTSNLKLYKNIENQIMQKKKKPTPSKC